MIPSASRSAAMKQSPTLDYAAAPPRRPCRLALVSLVWALLTTSPLVFVLFLASVDAHLVDRHLPCCNHPAAGFMLFVGLPLPAVLIGAAAARQLAKARGRLAGWVLCAAGIVWGAASAVSGFILLSLLKA